MLPKKQQTERHVILTTQTHVSIIASVNLNPLSTVDTNIRRPFIKIIQTSPRPLSTIILNNPRPTSTIVPNNSNAFHFNFHNQSNACQYKVSLYTLPLKVPPVLF